MIRKVSDGKTGGKGPSRAENGTVFEDKRSGRDRRESQTPAPETQRRVAERRKPSRGSQSAWWLERDYVESHHFVQKSSSPRPRKRDDDESPED